MTFWAREETEDETANDYMLNSSEPLGQGE